MNGQDILSCKFDDGSVTGKDVFRVKRSLSGEYSVVLYGKMANGLPVIMERTVADGQVRASLDARNLARILHKCCS